jgi:hypothetical protein
MQVKLRVIAKQTSGESIYGLTIPKDFAIFFKQTFFNIEKSGCAIILTSGCTNIPTKEEIKKYDFREGRI